MFFDNPIIGNIVDPFNGIDDFSFLADGSSSASTNYTLVLSMGKEKYDKFVALFNGLIDMSVNRNNDKVMITCWSYKDQQLLLRWSEQN